jgi:two-component system chemotaxis sensor kinase CheA
MTTANETLNRQLMGLFVQEVRDRSSELEKDLLGLENAADPETRRDFLAKLLRLTHSLKGAAGLLAIRPIEEACHRMEDLLARQGGQGDPVDRSTLELLLAATDGIAETGRMLERGEDVANGPLQGVLKELAAEVEGALQSSSQTPSPSKKVASETLPPVGGRRSSVSEAPAALSTDLDGSIRISAERLDSLLYRTGELLVSRSRSRIRSGQVASLRETARTLRLEANRRGSPTEIVGTAPVEPVASEGLAVLERDLRELAKGLADDDRHLHGAAALLDAEVRRARMQPFAQACEGLGRLVRDMSAGQGKSAQLSVEGGEIEIDRSILGVLHDALRHLVRNAVGHGLETPEARRAAGKPETGRIVVSAALRGERLQVRVQDDGRGIDLEALRQTAMNSIPDEDETELLRQVFLPGVTTSPSVTKLSGRGIGLDIVRSAVENLRGSAEVSHVPGGGAAFTMTLPLTLATVRALLINAGEQIFALDTTSVRRLVRISPTELQWSNGPNVLLHDGKSIPVLDLTEWLGFAPQTGARNPQTVTLIILGPDNGEAAILVDQVAGEQELLARSLGPRLARIREYSGGTILPDGQLALLLNAAALLEAATATNDKPAPHKQDILTSAKTRVLIVDDTPAIRALEKLILETAGYEVAMASNGSEAWDHLQAHGADAVIADVDMPVMDGVMLTQAIRGSESFRDLPVILVTARDTPQDKARGMDAGADAYVTKSEFDQQQFLEILRQVV